jgi:hypothetical protein
VKFRETSLRVEHLDEPDLEFAFLQSSAHRKDGLFLYRTFLVHEIGG